MRRTAVAISVLALTGTLVFPTVASPFTFAAVDYVGDDVLLAPIDGANGDYAYLDENDELVVDLTASNPNLDGEGVNADGVTGIANVFEIRYDGSEYAHVWLTHESDAVTFTAHDHPIQSEANNVTLGPNETVSVGLVVDTTGGGGDGLVDDVTVHAKVADPETVQSLRSPDDDGGDDELVVQSSTPNESSRSVTIRNAPGDDPVPVDLDPLVVDEVDAGDATLDGMTVTSDDGGDVSFDVAVAGTVSRIDGGPADAGADTVGTLLVEHGSGADAVSGVTFRFSVAESYLDATGVDPGELTVFRYSEGAWSELGVERVGERDDRISFEAHSPGFSAFAVAVRVSDIGVSEAELDRSTVATNGTATVTATVRNDGGAAGNRTLALALGGDTVAERTVALGAGDSTTVTFEVSPDAPGEYDVAVDGTAAGTLEVVVPADAAAEGVEDDVAATEEGPTRTPNAGADDTPTSAGGDARGDPQDTETDRAVAEPSRIGLAEVLGLASLLAILAATLELARRAPGRR